MSRIVIIGDPQVGSQEQENRMTAKLNRLATHESKVDYALIPGDLTQNGIGEVNSVFTKLCCMCAPYYAKMDVDMDENELEKFQNTYLNQLRAHAENVIMCHGNHDHAYTACYKPVINYIRRQYGGTVYMRRNKNFNILVLGKYPNDSVIKWLRRQLRDLYTNTSENSLIVMFHFNLSGPFSDWWSDELKDRFDEVLQNYKQHVAFIAVGHIHSSYISEWRGYRVVNGSGDQYVSATIDADGTVKAELV